MNCIYERNPYCGFIDEHTNPTCAYEHNPPQPVSHHVNTGGWCAKICWWCAERFEKKHSEVVKLKPWQVPRKIHPWEKLQENGQA